MTLMSKISTDYKLAGRSVQPIYERFQASLARFKGEGRLRFQGRKLTAEAMVNAVILRFLDLNHSDQERVLAEYVPRFEAMLAGDDVAEKQHGEGEETGQGSAPRKQEPPRIVAMQDLTEATERLVREKERPKKRGATKKGEGK
jgi:hypothetical protein